MKLCKMCIKEKPSEDFYTHNSKGITWLSSYCRPCHAKANKVNYEKNKAHHLEVGRRRSLKCLYGITEQDYLDMLEAQENKCAICESYDPGEKRKYFCVDHDHKTEVVRGLLCASCNKGIGHLKDDAEIISKALDYVKSKGRTNDTRDALEKLC